MKYIIKHKTFKKIYRINARLGIQHLINFIPDKYYLKFVYRIQLGKKLNFDCPITYNEKLQWLKIYDRNDMYTKLVDKYEVRKYVKNIVGEKYLIPLIGVWNSFDEIDFKKLPSKFVLKCTHDSGGIVVCSSKKEFDKKVAKRKLSRLLKNNYFDYLREWPYKNIKPRIIAEKYMTDGSGINKNQLKDYKFFCFEGIVKLVMVAQDRFEFPKSNFYNINFEPIDLKIGNPNFFEKIERPLNFNLMIKIAEKLSKGLRHVRVDLYNIDGKIYFGELTFFHWGGISIIEPIEWDIKMGKWINLV